VKALDTSVLLGLLEGSPAVREQLRHLRGVELATTESNMLELACLAGRGARRPRAERLAALARLRRRITVLPVDQRATEEASRRVTGDAPGLSPLALAMLGALEASGCDELLTADPLPVPGKWRFRVRRIH
jgi:predicted nucleic acid-binding protein